MDTTNTTYSPVSNAVKTNEAVFEKLYLQLRQLENRIYTDNEVALLPNIHLGHPHEKEWQIRKDSSEKLLRYLIKKNRPLEILEVGCGNGWLSAKLSSVLASHVTGMDINSIELTQAKRIFNKIRNLDFFYGLLQDDLLKKRRFDIIVFAASIQYFHSLQYVLKDFFSCLNPGGEIHLIDSPFYKLNEIANARQRSKAYYESLGFPQMANHYFHHSLEEIRSFNYKILYNPDSIFNNLKKNKNPFHWVCIKKDA